MTWFVFVLALLAGARTFDLLVHDEILERFRDWLLSKSFFWTEDTEPTFWYRGWKCPFCLGFWITAGWALTGAIWGDTIVWLIAAGAMAANYVQANLNARFHRGD